MRFISGLFIVALMGLSACGSVDTVDYANKKPTLDIREYLNGPLTVVGIVQNRNGEAEPYFHANLNGKWNGNHGTLEEHFTYSDGRTDTRLWVIDFTDDHHFTATAADVIGTAIGEQYGNAMHMTYTLDAKRSGSDRVTLDLDDWIYRVDSHRAINHATMHKFGVQVGELIVSFDKK